MLLNDIIQHRIDLAIFALVALGGAWLCSIIIGQIRPGALLSLSARIMTLVMVVAGGFAAEWAAHQRRDSLISIFSGFGPTYAYELQKGGHAKITYDTPGNDPLYLSLIETEKNWLKLNPLVADIYTYRRDEKGHLRILVDSETDYDRNGLIEGEREQRTAIGEEYNDGTESFYRAADGVACFDPKVTADRWGVWVSSLTPLRDNQGRVEGVLGIDYPAHDWVISLFSIRAVAFGSASILIGILLTASSLITLMRAEIKERQESQQKLHASKQAAELASRGKADFLAMMGHEIRGPVTDLMGATSSLAETSLDSVQERSLDAIINAGQRLAELLNDIVDFSKIEEGSIELQTSSFSPLTVIRSVTSYCAPIASAKNIALACENKSAQLPDLEGDPARLRQVLLNLVNNAVKFTHRGSVDVKASWHSLSEKSTEGILSLEISDTGPGIGEEKLALISSFLADPKTKSPHLHYGNGLGLAICKSLIGLMGGSIKIASVAGKGSTFTVTVPMTVAARANQLRENSPTFLNIPTDNRVLVVDDNATNRELMHAFLKQMGLASDFAINGEDAIQLSSKNSYSAIFMDLHMPELNGFDTTQKIRAQEPEGRRVPIIAVATTPEDGTLQKCIASGMDEYLMKPFPRQQLESLIERLIKSPPLSV